MSKKPSIVSAKSWDLVKRLARDYVRPQLRPILISLLFMAVFSGCTATLAWLMKPIVNLAFGDKDITALYRIAAAVLALFFLRGWSAFIQSTMMNQAGQTIVATLQNQLFSHIVRADMAFFARQSRALSPRASPSTPI